MLVILFSGVATFPNTVLINSNEKSQIDLLEINQTLTSSSFTWQSVDLNNIEVKNLNLSITESNLMCTATISGQLGVGSNIVKVSFASTRATCEEAWSEVFGMLRRALAELKRQL